MTALTGTLLPAIAAGKKTDLRRKTPVNSAQERQGLSDRRWEQILGRVASGENIKKAIRGMNISPSVLEGHLISDKKAKGQLDDAKIQALQRIWSEDMVEEVLVAICLGATVKAACANVFMEDKVESFYKLMLRDPNTKAAYEEARMIQAEKMAIDDIIEIADEDADDLTLDNKPNSAAVNRSRLKVDSRKWIAGKLHYKRFGDRIQQDIDQTIVVDHAARLEAARKRKDAAHKK